MRVREEGRWRHRQWARHQRDVAPCFPHTDHVFDVLVSTPPPRSLGTHALPPDTHNGDRVEIDGDAFVVRGVVLNYRLVKGRYVRAGQTLEVSTQGRFLAERFLEGLVNR